MSIQKTYWNENRHEDSPKWQKMQDRISAEVPDSGSADHPAVDCWREVQNIYYDFFNNGGCNLVSAPFPFDDFDGIDDDDLDTDGLDYRMDAIEKFMGEDSWECKALREAAIECVRNFHDFCNDHEELERCVDSILYDCFHNRFKSEVTK